MLVLTKPTTVLSGLGFEQATLLTEPLLVFSAATVYSHT